MFKWLKELFRDDFEEELRAQCEEIQKEMEEEDRKLEEERKEYDAETVRQLEAIFHSNWSTQEYLKQILYELRVNRRNMDRP